MPERTDHVLTPPATELLGCLEDALALFHDPADRPANIHLRTGNQAEPLLSTTRDECCEGLAWVRVVTWYPTTAFPEQQVVYNRCAVLLWGVVLEMGVARCAPMTDASQLPSAEEWAAVTERVNADSAAMQRAVCCFKDADPDRMWLAAPWAPIATEGGCVGGTMQLTVAMPPCNC
jgi:hypothetical protein